MNTGDLVFFRQQGWLPVIGELLGRSSYSHVGMVIVNPPEKYGVHLLHTYYNYEEERYDIRLDPLSEFTQNEFPNALIEVRKAVVTRDQFFLGRVDQMLQILPNLKETNLLEWIAHQVDSEFLGSQRLYHNTHRYWCSCFVFYLCYYLGWVQTEHDWSMLSPQYLSQTEAEWTIEMTAARKPITVLIPSMPVLRAPFSPPSSPLHVSQLPPEQLV
jgi:hypothetical protein